MSKALAAAVLEAAESLRNNPDQFTFEINVTGLNSSANVHSPMYGGTVIGTSVRNSGPGTGMHVSTNMSGSDVSIAVGNASESKRQMVESWADDMQSISREMESDAPDRGFLARSLEKLGASGLPAATLTLVTALVNAAANAS